MKGDDQPIEQMLAFALYFGIGYFQFKRPAIKNTGRE